MNFDKNNPNNEQFVVRWWEDDHMLPHKAKERIVHSIKEGAELLEWITSNNWSYTVQ